MSHKIDDYATQGLLGVSNSLSYRVGEIERHFHSYERWLCAAAVPSATHIADRIGVTGTSVAAFVATSGNNTWGAWLQIMGSDDTPVVAGGIKFDLHRILITTTNQTGIWFIQIGFGATGAAALAADTFCSLVYVSEGSGDRSAPIGIQTRRQTAGALAWVRAWSVASNAKTIALMFGLHEYEG